MIVIHTILGVIAITAGAWNLITTKGTQQHKMVGYIYVVSMTVLIITSFTILELFGGFGPYHIMSLVSGGTIALAIYFPLQRSKYKNWLEHHYMWITWSYVGLLMATGSHLFEYGPPGWPFWARALLYWGLPCLTGAFLISKNRSRLLNRLSASTQVL